MEERTPSVYQVELVQGVKCGHMHARIASRKAQLFTINAKEQVQAKEKLEIQDICEIITKIRQLLVKLCLLFFQHI